MTTTHSSNSFANAGVNAAVEVRSHRSTNPLWLELIREAVEAADFGTVQIKVHGGEVVQIEATRKIRVPATVSRFSFHPTAPAEESYESNPAATYRGTGGSAQNKHF